MQLLFLIAFVFRNGITAQPTQQEMLDKFNQLETKNENLENKILWFENETQILNPIADPLDPNSTSYDTCSYVEQADGSVLISTLHQYQDSDYCHEYWECENSDHNMLYKWNRVEIEDHSDCAYDWARFAWGTGVDKYEKLCDENNLLTNKQKGYRDTGGNKIQWDFDTDVTGNYWGAEAQIICKDPADINECIDGTHDCAEGAECIKTFGQFGFTCQCPSGGIKWGDQTLTLTGAGTNSDPCKYVHPEFTSMEVFPIAWDRKILGAIFDELRRRVTWQDALKRCNMFGMTLPLPSNDAENTALTNFLANRTNYEGIFLGAHNSNVDREWVNLYTGDAMTYNQWSAGQPDNADNAEKVAKMWTDNGDWNDITLTNVNEGLLCIKVDYEDWHADNMDMGEFFCETGLHRCHASSVCRNSTYRNSYQCECDDIRRQGIDLIPISDIVGWGSECEYTLPGLNVQVNVFTYDGKPTVYHQIVSYDGEEYADSVKYCAGLGMHLPVPNTEQQYQDLKTIPRKNPTMYSKSYWLGFSDSANEGIWLNIYTGEELVIDKWGGDEPNDAGQGEDQVEMFQYGAFQWSDINGDRNDYRSTLCMKTDLEVELDFCRMNLHDCSAEATCVGKGNSWTCTCQNVQIGDWDLEPASTSYGKGSNGCHYFHPNADGHRVFSVKYGGKVTAVYIGDAAGSNFYDYAAKCQSLGMRLLTPKNTEEAELIYQLRSKPGADKYMQVPLGITRASDGQWRNIYTNNKAWINFGSMSNENDYYGDRDFAYGSATYFGSANLFWFVTNFGTLSSSYPYSSRTICIATEESTEIDFCATGFNDCHEGASCTNAGDAGYICECQPLQFGDVEVAPVDAAGTGKSCTYNMPGHDDKTLFPVRVNNNARGETVYAFHASNTKYKLRDAIMYCGALGMHLPLPKNDKENAAMRKVLPGQYMEEYWLGFSDSGEDLTYRNIYTGAEQSYTNWDVNEPNMNLTYGSAYTNVAMKREDGKWAVYTDSTDYYYLKTVCQKGAVDVSKVDWCAAGLHDCHVDANCLPSDEENTPYTCACKDPKFYDGNGIGENGCVLKLGSKFLIDNYNVDVTINDRYVRTQIAVSVANKNTNSAELYEFGVNLDHFEFISGLTMRMGDDGAVSIGDVHKEKEAITSTEIVTRDTTFSNKVNIPAGKKLYIWLNYDMQLKRERASYAYTTNVFPYDAVSKMSVSVTIEESRSIDAEKTAVYWESEGKPEGAIKNKKNAFTLNEASSNKWEFSFEKEFIDAEEWNDNLRIEYDLERLDNTCGDIVMRDGYFIHYIAPKGLGSIPKNVILTVDTSGSMGLERMNNAKAAMITILDTLTDQDTFWLQEFNSRTSAWTSNTVQATASNLENAKRWVNSLSAGGGTDLYSGVFNSVQRPLDSNRANLAFIISDGYPTSGITRWSDIQAGILAANSIKNSHGEEIGQKWAIYNFGIGNGAPMFELNKLSTWNMGVGRQVFDDSDVHAQLTAFFNEYSIPLVWNNQFHYSGASEYDCSGTNLYADQELTCIGKLPSSNQCGDIDDLGFTPGNTLLAGVNMMDVSIFSNFIFSL